MNNSATMMILSMAIVITVSIVLGIVKQDAMLLRLMLVLLRVVLLDLLELTMVRMRLGTFREIWVRVWASSNKFISLLMFKF